MARNEIEVMATPERVFAVLSDPSTYGHWVVGSKTIRDADERWPAVGARLHHTVGVGPLTLSDHTEVLESDPPRRLVLKARARPLGSAKVVLEIRGIGSDRSEVVMFEDAGDRLTQLMFNPLTHRLVHARNVESLRRLKGLAEG